MAQGYHEDTPVQDDDDEDSLVKHEVITPKKSVDSSTHSSVKSAQEDGMDTDNDIDGVPIASTSSSSVSNNGGSQPGATPSEPRLEQCVLIRCIHA